MTRLTVNEIFGSYVNRYGQDHVHEQSDIPFSGRPGHHYFVNRRVSNEHLAQITYRSRNAETALIRMNDAYIVSIGNIGVATAQISVPARHRDIDVYRWISHTHPLDQESRHQRIVRGPTRHDYIALDQIHRRGWGQNDSIVVVCRRGRVVRVVRFERESPPISRRGEDALRSFTIEP